MKHESKYIPHLIGASWIKLAWKQLRISNNGRVISLILLFAISLADCLRIRIYYSTLTRLQFEAVKFNEYKHIAMNNIITVFNVIIRTITINNMKCRAVSLFMRHYSSMYEHICICMYIFFIMLTRRGNT